MSENASKNRDHDFRRFLKNIAFTGLALVFIFIITRPDGGPQLGSMAPDFKTQTLTRQAVSLDQYKGQVVVLDFWATWCAPCRKTLPALQILHKRYQNSDRVQILSVSIDSAPNLARYVGAFMKQNQYSFPVILDPSRALASRYKVKTVPTMVVIDKSGAVSTVQIGLLSPRVNQLIDHIEKAIAQAEDSSS
ncbi:MAG: TlpA disulfide reductase family protein [Myxococcota bacterium]|nr:TlpA disulfide reductase family protein [Myxococcota bacterium]